MVFKYGIKWLSSAQNSFILAVISLIATIYLGIFYEKKPELRIEIFSNAPIFQVMKNEIELEIFFQGKDIIKNNQLISLFTLKFSNFGNQAIRIADFSDRQPFSIFIKTGELIETKLIEFSSEKFGSQFKDNEEGLSADKKGFAVDKRGIIFAPFIMESGDFMIIKMLILHHNKEMLSVDTIDTKGIIANVNPIEIRDSLKSKVKREDLIKESTQGGLNVQFFRFFLYYSPIIIVIFLLKIRDKKIKSRTL